MLLYLEPTLLANCHFPSLVTAVSIPHHKARRRHRWISPPDIIVLLLGRQAAGDRLHHDCGHDAEEYRSRYMEAICKTSVGSRAHATKTGEV